MATKAKKRTNKETTTKKAAPVKTVAAAPVEAAPVEAAPVAAAPVAAAPVETASDANSDEKKNWKKYQDLFEKVVVQAAIPGIEGTIPVTLIQVTFNDGDKKEVYRANTRKEAQAWVRGKRKERTEEIKKKNAVIKQQRELERAAKIAPYITEKLEKLAVQISGLSLHAAVAEAEHEVLREAIFLIMKTVEMRKAVPVPEKEEETA